MEPQHDSWASLPDLAWDVSMPACVAPQELLDSIDLSNYDLDFDNGCGSIPGVNSCSVPEVPDIDLSLFPGQDWINLGYNVSPYNNTQLTSAGSDHWDCISPASLSTTMFSPGPLSGAASSTSSIFQGHGHIPSSPWSPDMLASEAATSVCSGSSDAASRHMAASPGLRKLLPRPAELAAIAVESARSTTPMPKKQPRKKARAPNSAREIRSKTKPEACPSCPMRFPYLRDLLRHMEKHEAGRLRHPCPGCRKTYTRADNVLRHLKKDHPGLVPF